MKNITILLITLATPSSVLAYSTSAKALMTVTQSITLEKNIVIEKTIYFQKSSSKETNQEIIDIIL